MLPFDNPLLLQMTMKKIYLMMTLAVMVSCMQETVEQKKVTVAINDTAVKTGFSTDRDALIWENGDRIGFYHDGEGLQNVLMEFTGNDQMSLSVPFDAKNIYSLYPYETTAGTDPDGVNICIPAYQTQKRPGVLEGERWPMAAAGTIMNDHVTLTFNPLTALLALNIYSSEAADGEAVTMVKITPTLNERFSGNAVIDITLPGAAFTSGDSSQPVTLTITQPEALVNEKPSNPKLFEDMLYVSIAKQAYTYVKFEIHTSAGKLYTLTSNSNVIDAAGNDVTTMNINLSKGKISIVQYTGTEEMTEVDGTLSALEEVIRDPMYDDIKEDIIPDFSRVGYHYGDDEIPHYDNVIATLYPTGDMTDRADEIQAALDAADGVTNSVVLLKEGDYYVSRQIEVRKSHLVLRGEGGKARYEGEELMGWKTRLIATGDSTMNACVKVGKTNKSQVADMSSITDVVESYVAVGRMSICVRDASRFNVADRIIIYRPGTQQWIHDIRMDAISDGEHWSPDTFHISQERIITGIIGNRLILDAPIVMAIDQYYGGGQVLKVDKDVIYESGLEDLFVESMYDSSIRSRYTSTAIVSYYSGGVVHTDENHCHNGVKATSCEHCWVKGVSGRHFVFSMVGMGQNSRNVTVVDCHSYYPVSLIQGSRRYAFNANNKTTMGLFKDCTAEYDRHQFVTTSLSTGPLVYTNCSATKCIGETGPHCFWAAGVLYDCIKMDSNKISVQDSDFTGTGASHGWQGANHVLWNCESPEIVCQSPWTAKGRNPTGRNYCIGCIGTKKLSTTKHFVTKEYLNDRPQAEWIPDPGEGRSNTGHVTSGTYFGATANGLSLYEAQLAARKASGIRAIPAEWYK